jgi:hypothetical protein
MIFVDAETCARFTGDLRLVRASLGEVSQLDGAGYFIPRRPRT